MIIYQAQTVDQVTPGRWFGFRAPASPKHSHEMFNLAEHKNFKPIGKIKVFRIKEEVAGYYGGVRGGSAVQFYIPKEIPLSEVLEEITDAAIHF